LFISAEMPHRHARLGLAGAGRPIPNTRSLRSMASRYRRWFTISRQHLLAEYCAVFAALDQRAQGHLGVGGHHAQVAVQIAVIEDVAFRTSAW